MKILIILLLASAALCQEIKNDSSNPADAHLQLGIKNEMIMMFNQTLNSGTELSLPLNIHGTAGFSFLEDYKIDYRVGLMYIYEDYNGIDQGIFFEARLFKKLYGTVGFDWINIEGNAHGVMTYSETRGKTKYLVFGFGYSSSRNLKFDLSWYAPLDKIYGYNQVNNVTPVVRYEKINNGLIALGIQYSFIF